MKTIVRNIGQLLTNEGSTTDNPLGIISEALLEFENGRVTWIGAEKSYRHQGEVEEIDAQGAFVSPGLVDCHSHAVFAGDRSHEFYERLAGVSYEEIQKRGGGIHATVAKTRAASKQELKKTFQQRLNRFLSFGVTTLEVKSGYGLNWETEEKLLQIIKDTAHPVKTISTFLGAHLIPKDYASRREEYIQELITAWLPTVAKQNLANFCDVFCDEHAFTIAESKKILTAAQAQGLKLKIHADQLSCTEGAVLAGELETNSADHLEFVSEIGIQALKKNNVVAVLIPGANFSMGKTKRPPARALIEAGVNVAVSTDCNPGTSCSENLPFMMSLAAIELKMTSAEIWKSVTVHAAKACDQPTAGKLTKDSPATFVIWDATHYEEIPYRYASCLPSAVWVSGKKTYHSGRIH